ncbi:MAG TPA: shikimate dehydrogenase [Desulfonatronum sp.]|nr:shikimate dehydrogenase [Desulfonatronum sp.]
MISNAKTAYNGDVFLPQELYGIIGQPLDHSLSPLAHNFGFQSIGLDAVYFRWPLKPSGLANFVQAARTLPISGLSVTIPHKRAVMVLLDGCTGNAMRAGAVNTIFWRDDRLWGENTDIHGFLSPMSPEEWRRMQRALVLGYGGAARAVLIGLAKVGVGHVTICGRDQERAAVLAEEFRVHVLDWACRGQWQGDLLINATPLGMSGKYGQLSPWPAGLSLKGIRTIYDLVYNPLETRLILQAKNENIATINGLEMFLGQAAAQFTLWTGRSFPLSRLRDIAVRHATSFE